MLVNCDLCVLHTYFWCLNLVLNHLPVRHLSHLQLLNYSINHLIIYSYNLVSSQRHKL